MGRSRNIALDPRLSMIAELVGECERYADIGCDHGRLGAFLLQSGRCASALLTDVSAPSLEKARRLIALLGLSERAAFRVGDGAEVLDGPVDAAVIAGMGGALIARIVRQGRARLGGARLVLQPNVAAAELRGALSETGYRIADERLVRDGRRHYAILLAVPGASAYTLKERIVGPVLLQRRPPELAAYAAFHLRVARRALAGAEGAGDAAQADPLRAEAEIWEEVCACLRA